ncbi:hypothetical protein L1987_02109 [Smallanthus sonchifolius]|uniref:Uncharacterized protein n=1 Tax=Smallanthus sonchifolius TaxID=185202 RepID=A0ACB9K730_9ASTR|nr:hypothetical protein L1987_02109 [Smallanthus sonchifolius]
MKVYLLFVQLTALLAEVGLNIQEAHAFSTVDRYSLDVFVVDGWPYEETEQFRTALEKELFKLEKQSWPSQSSSSPLSELDQPSGPCQLNCLTIPNDGTDVWEIDSQFLILDHKVASGSYGDLYEGTYHSQEVAIKIHKTERANKDFAEGICPRSLHLELGGRKVEYTDDIDGVCEEWSTFVSNFIFR